MSLAIVNAVYARGGFDLTTDEGCGKFTEAVVLQLRSEDVKWGHIRKSPGQHHVVDPQGNLHAVDALMSHFDGRVFDIVVDSAAPGAKPGWQDKGIGDLNAWFAPQDGPPPLAFPPVIVTPAPLAIDYSGDLTDIKNKLDNVMRLVEELVVRPQPSVPEAPVVKFPNYSGNISIPYLGNRAFTLKPELT